MQMILTLTHRCNLNCENCFAGEHHRTDISDEVIARALALLRRSQDPSHRLSFFGGEPFLAFNQMKEAARRAKDDALTAGRDLRLAVTTNATLLSEAQLDWIVENHVQMTVSLDGIKEANDLSRPLAGGGSSFEQVTEGLRALIEADQDPNVNLVLRPQSARYLSRSIQWLYEESVTRVSISLDHGAPWSLITRAVVRAQLLEVCAFWARAQRKGEAFGINLFAPVPTKKNRLKLAVSPRGHLYPCAAFVGADLDEGRGAGQRLGHISEDPDALLARLTQTRCQPGEHCECAAFVETGDKAQRGPNGLWFSRLCHELRAQAAAPPAPKKRRGGLLLGMGLQLIGGLSCATIPLELDPEAICQTPEVQCQSPEWLPPPSLPPASTISTPPSSIPMELPPAPATVLEVKSTPTRAKVFLDGVLVGVTPARNKKVAAALSLTVTPGEHTLRFEKEGYTTQERTVKAKAQETQAIKALLEHVPIKPDDDFYMTDGVMMDW